MQYVYRTLDNKRFLGNVCEESYWPARKRVAILHQSILGTNDDYHNVLGRLQQMVSDASSEKLTTVLSKNIRIATAAIGRLTSWMRCM